MDDIAMDGEHQCSSSLLVIQTLIQYDHSSHHNFFFFIFVQMKKKLENPVVWSFL